MWGLRHVRPRQVAVALLLATAVAVSVLAGAAWGTSTGGPKKSTPLTILYTGSFTMKNQAVPETTSHSYTFTVNWTYWWTGTWASLFRDPSVYRSSPSRFTKVKIAGKVDVTYKLKVDDAAVQNCLSPIFRDNANRPTVTAAYDTSANTLQIVVEAPTYRSIKYGDLNCADGPGTNVLGPGTSQTSPAFFNPLGAGGTVRLSTGGTARYEKEWKWTHTFASATKPVPYRDYTASMRSKVMVTYTPCKLIPACAKAKP